MVWSFRFGKIKSSIANLEQSSALKQTKAVDAFFLPDFSDNRTLLELLVTANILAVIMSLISAHNLDNMAWGILAQYVFFINWVTVTFAWLADLLRPRLRSLPRPQALLWSLVLLESIVLLASIACNFGLVYLLNEPRMWWSDLLYNLMLGALLGMLIMRYLYEREQRIRRHRAELLSRVQALQARIRPHFLFNTMNSVLSLIATDPIKAEQMVENLSGLFRASLNATGEVCLLDEVETCKQYLAIEAIRLGDRLFVDWRLPSEDALYDVNIPSLTLQPLLENAIYHGVETFSQSSKISVLVEVTAQEVTIVVTNPYQTGKKVSRSGNGMALENIQERLEAYYGKKARLKTYQADGLFTTYLYYPYVAQ